MNLPNLEISQVYKSFVAWVAAGSTGLALILNVLTTQLAVAPAWPQDFTVMLAPFDTAAPDDPIPAASLFASGPPLPPHAPSKVVAAIAPVPFNSTCRRLEEKFLLLAIVILHLQLMMPSP
jgi:hypothetical protein